VINNFSCRAQGGLLTLHTRGTIGTGSFDVGPASPSRRHSLSVQNNLRTQIELLKTRTARQLKGLLNSTLT
jgi:hypothetical protein